MIPLTFIIYIYIVIILITSINFKIQYRRGTAIANLDGLSRLANPNMSSIENDRFEDVLLNLKLNRTMFEEIGISIEEVKNNQRIDPNFERLILECSANNNESRSKMFVLQEEILYKREKDGSLLLMIPTNILKVILKVYHHNDLMIHLSISRLYQLLRKRFYWISMHEDCKNWVAACQTCQKVKLNQPISSGLLKPIISSKPFELLGIDILGPLKLSKNNYKYILICVDHFTSWVEAIALKGITAVEVIEAFFKLIIARHGCPEKLLSDHGTQFTSNLFHSLCDYFNIEKVFATAYHQQTNGKTRSPASVEGLSKN